MEPTTTDTAPAGAPKIKAMRRQPCPCGSGKKFKNCHLDDPAYEVAADSSEAEAPASTTASGGAAAKGSVGSAAKHFPPHQQKSIPSQRAANSTHRRRV